MSGSAFIAYEKIKLKDISIYVEASIPLFLILKNKSKIIDKTI
jgi:hypothetical protein